MTWGSLAVSASPKRCPGTVRHDTCCAIVLESKTMSVQHAQAVDVNLVLKELTHQELSPKDYYSSFKSTIPKREHLVPWSIRKFERQFDLI